MANTNRFSSYTSVSAGSGNNAAGSVSASAAGGADGAGGSGGKQKKDLWNSMLDSVASGRKLPERNLLVLGGSVDSQREFLASLGDPKQQSSLSGEAQLPGGAPVANNFALGYTYYDVLDADQDGDILARISLYLLSKPSPSFSSLLQPLLTPETIPNTLIVILLDWAQPWRWLRQLREWILLLRTVLVSLSPASKEALEETMEQWRERGRGGARNLDGTTTAGTGSGNAPAGADSGDALPPGPGEWEDALGLPLCVVCQNSEKTDVLEKTQGWKDDEFDLVLQYLRTVLVKHGASLIYTTPNVPSQLPTLIHACLGVTSLLKRQPLKPEVIKRTEVVVPSNWDSWTKILVVREGFEVDKVSAGWSIDLQRPFPVVQAQAQTATAATASSNPQNNASQISRTTSPPLDGENGAGGEQETFEGQGEGEVGVTGKKNNSNSNNNESQSFGDDDYDDDDDEDPDSAVSQYERAIRDPGMDVLALAGGDLDEEDEDEEGEENDGTQKRRRRRRRQQLEVETEDVQLFLGDQLKLLDQFRQKDEAKRDKEAKESKRRESSTGGGSGPNANAGSEDPAEVISSHIGPVQFNIGGIQVDADDMLERIKNRHGYGSASPEPGSPDGASVGAGVAGGSAAGGGGTGVGADGTPLAPENVDTEKMTAFFADLMNRPSQTRKS